MNSNDINASRNKSVVLIQKMLSDEISPQEAIDRWPHNTGDDLLEQAYCLLYHYRDDSDIRAKDPRYMEIQKEQFREIADKLTLNQKGHR